MVNRELKEKLEGLVRAAFVNALILNGHETDMETRAIKSLANDLYESIIPQVRREAVEVSRIVARNLRTRLNNLRRLQIDEGQALTIGTLNDLINDFDGEVGGFEKYLESLGERKE